MAERLRLFAEEPTIAIVDRVLEILDDLDAKSQRHQNDDGLDALDDDQGALREALKHLKDAHRSLVDEARSRLLT